MPANVIAAQPRARRLVEIVRFNAQDAREFSDPLVRDTIASVFIAADLPRRYVGCVGKLAHCHPAMLTVFLQALSDVCVDGALAIHGVHPPNAKNWPPRLPLSNSTGRDSPRPGRGPDHHQDNPNQTRDAEISRPKNN